MYQRKNKGMKIVNQCIVIILVGILLLSGCSKKQDEKVSNIEEIESQDISGTPTVTAFEPTPSAVSDNVTVTPENITNVPNVTETPNNTEEQSVVVNNGGRYVGFKDKVYYREYNKDSFEATGIFGEYMDIPGSKKNMVYKDRDGSIDLAFEDTGFGDIYISNNRMFLTKYQKDDYVPVIYSVGMNGEDLKEYGNGFIEGIDEKSNSLVCMLNNEAGMYQLQVIDTKTGETKQLELTNPCMSFVDINDGVIYYMGEVAYEESQLGKMKLCSVHVDGTNELLLYETEDLLYDYSDGTEIPCIQFADDNVYFSYGSYAGTGHFYQGGRIVLVKKDGSEHQVIAGMVTDTANADINKNLVDENFYVAKVDGKEILFFSRGYEDIFALTVATGEAVESNFPIFQEGKPFEYEHGVYVYQNTSPTMTTLIPNINYSHLGVDQISNDLFNIEDIEILDNQVYYRLEGSMLFPDASIGWRDGYQRSKTVIMRQGIGSEKTEKLFEY